MKLNDTQRKMVEDNHNLIYSFMNSHGLSDSATEDWYGIVAEGLCKAAVRYDESRGVSFSSFAYACMCNEVRHEMNHRKKDLMSYTHASLDYELGGKNSEPAQTLVADIGEYTYSYELSDAIEKEIERLSERDRTIISLCVDEGMSHEKIGELVGLSRSAVSHVYCAFVNKIHLAMA